MGGSVSTKEFTIFMRVLFSMDKFKNGIEGANEILDFVHASCDLDKDFSPSAEQVDTRLYTWYFVVLATSQCCKFLGVQYTHPYY